MRLNDAVPGVFLILFALAEMAYTTTFPATFGQQIGPDLFPRLIGVGLLGCGVLLVISGLGTREQVPLVTLGDWATDSRAFFNFLLVPVALLFYILASDWLGFIISSLIILLTLLYRFGVSLLTSLAVAVGTTIVIQFVFASVLLVPLPWGLFQPVVW
ncbi:MAG: tripartite tricarboxylate transporter TctB family protein [Hyphomicrobiales bacterium]|nr:tripartite tricarboxylate transporter TctB family protein [Hyphomicrobiales bacterium]